MSLLVEIPTCLTEFLGKCLIKYPFHNILSEFHSVAEIFSKKKWWDYRKDMSNYQYIVNSGDNWSIWEYQTV